MTAFFATAWLISVPLFLFMLATRRKLWSVPASGPAKAVLIAIFAGNVITAIALRFGFNPLLLGTSCFVWSGFLLLCFFWARGIYLLCNPVMDRTVDGG